jgi:hypothetical protein
MCPICLSAMGPGTTITLNCGGGHIFHTACIAQMTATLGTPVGTGEQFSNGSLISYLELPRCPICRGRFVLAPHINDPAGLDGYANNSPEVGHARVYYAGGTILTAPQVQQYVLDAATNAVQAVNILQQQNQDDQTDESDTEDDDGSMEVDDVGPAPADVESYGFRICVACNQQAEFISYANASQYNEEKPEEDDTPCHECDVDVVDADHNVVACMGCWAVWHENCW